MAQDGRVGKWLLMHFADDETGDRLSLGYGLKDDGNGPTWYLLATNADGEEVEHAFRPRPRAVHLDDLVTWLATYVSPSNASALAETFAAKHPELMASPALG